MARKKKVSPQQFTHRMEKVRNFSAALLSPPEIDRVVDMLKEANLEAAPLSENEQALLASSGAMLIQCVLNEKFSDLALLVRAIYTIGVQRGRAEQQEAKTGKTQPLIDQLRDVRKEG